MTGEGCVRVSSCFGLLLRSEGCGAHLTDEETERVESVEPVGEPHSAHGGASPNPLLPPYLKQYKVTA